jgi:hypothetical protein
VGLSTALAHSTGWPPPFFEIWLGCELQRKPDIHDERRTRTEMLAFAAERLMDVKVEALTGAVMASVRPT